MESSAKLILREAIFRVACRHKQGERPNILLFCTRRGGSTWVLNTVAAHPGMRYVGRPFMTILDSRWSGKMPCLKKASGYKGEKTLRQIIHFEGADEQQFLKVAKNIVGAKWHIYPTLNFRGPYFRRVTDRVIFQMTSGLPLIKWFEQNLDVEIMYLVRHPIPNALSIMQAGWPPECFEFLGNQYFVETHLNDKQIDLARKIENGNSLLARHVLDWCLKNLVPLRELCRSPQTNWLTVSYEDLVARPLELIRRMANALDLSDIESVSRQVKLPSRTVSSSTADRVDDPSYLLSRWRNKIKPDEEKSLMKILQSFDLDIYESGRDEPTSKIFLTG